MAAAAPPTCVRISSSTPPLTALHRPRRRRVPSARCSLAAAPGIRAPAELVDSILSKVKGTDRGVLLPEEGHQEVADVASQLGKYCMDEPVKSPLIFGGPLVPIEEERLKTIMRNNARMQELGLKSLATLVASPTVFTPKKIKKEDSASEYDPEGESDGSEGDVSCQSLGSEDNELQASKKRMSPCTPNDTGGVMLKKTCVEPSLSKYQLEAELDSEKQGNDNLRNTIAELKLAKEESEQVRLKFLVDMQEMSQQQADLKESQEQGVALLELLVARYCDN